jgi:hypothetical protein
MIMSVPIRSWLYKHPATGKYIGFYQGRMLQPQWDNPAEGEQYIKEVVDGVRKPEFVPIPPTFPHK